MSASHTREERIAVARSRFVGRAEGDAQLLRAEAHKLRGRAECELRTIRETAHRLAGTAGSYGFMPATEAARDLLELITRDASREEIADRVERLSEELERMDRGGA